MSSWIALKNNEMTKMLLENYPNAFLLLTQIGLRAWWKTDEKSPVGLEYGQAFIGDYKAIGLTEKGYRVAKRRLAKGGLVTFVGANKGTIATLVDSRVYSISNKLEGGLGADSGTGKGRAKGGEGATNSHTHSQPHHKALPNTKAFVAPSLEEFVSYLQTAAPKLNDQWTSERVTRCATNIYDTYDEQGWKDGKGKQIKNWKTKCRNAISYRKPYEFGNDTKPAQQSFTEINAQAKSNQFQKNLSNPLY